MRTTDNGWHREKQGAGAHMQATNPSIKTPGFFDSSIQKKQFPIVDGNFVTAQRFSSTYIYAACCAYRTNAKVLGF